jgi:hypothetical protein
VKARGNAPGVSDMSVESAEGAKYQLELKTYPPSNIIPRLQRFVPWSVDHLDRWPKLIHFAPLSLITNRFMEC